MPILQVKISREPTPALVQALAERLITHTVDILHKDRQLIAITVDHTPPTQWVVGGRTLAEQGRHSAFLDIKITDGTNTKDEKARFIAACHADFAQLLGPLHEESYIHVHDVRAEAYGYGGFTQEWRYIRARL